MFGEISTFYGPLADRDRAEMLDEGLAILLGLWSGAAFAFNGTHFRLRETRFLPRPLQSPRIPIWVAGTWPKKRPFRRAARYDGAIAVAGDIASSLSPDEVSNLVSYIQQFRTIDSSFDIVHFGETTGTNRAEDRDVVAAYEGIGLTWWIESMFPRYIEVKSARARILEGPPSLFA